ncbi:MAG TPA: hypothetical protein VHC86_04735 [Opitutaceae bacterium]|nr:hypothetical protein [Opitutaceae bacterium]
MSRAFAITAAAVAVLAGFFLIPARPHLTHMDFIAGGPDALQFCDAANPRFLPVVARDSPVSAALSGTGPHAAGRECELSLVLRTNTGKAIGPRDLTPTGGRKLNLYAVDPSLTDFHALDPQPAGAGRWRLSFTPRAGGVYRLFADFTPVATGQEMYVSADLPVQGAPAAPAAGQALAATFGGREYRLASRPRPVRIREPALLTLRAGEGTGGAAAGSELVAFDRARSGMVDLRLGRDGSGRVTFPDSGLYAVWARLGGGGAVPFSIAVEP